MCKSIVPTYGVEGKIAYTNTTRKKIFQIVLVCFAHSTTASCLKFILLRYEILSQIACYLVYN